jgi:glycosyltransferase involved in cell wall biosynthesis
MIGLASRRLDPGVRPENTALTVVAHDVTRIGGMERQLSTLIVGALDAGLEVTLVSRSCELPPHPSFRWIRIPGPSRPFPVAYPWFFLAAGIVVARRAPKLLHVTGAIVPNRADVCTVHLCHAGIAERKGLTRAQRASPAYRLSAQISRWISRVMERVCYRPSRARTLVGVSTGVTTEVSRHFPAMAKRAITIPNGVDTSTFRPARDDRERKLLRDKLFPGSEPNVALFVGNEWDGKGLKTAIEGIAHLPTWRLAVVGDGDVPRFQRYADRLGSVRQVHFLGRATDTAPFYRAADAFLLPSGYETFSLVTYEAAASGLPLLVTRVSGVEEILRAGRNGWFIEQTAACIAERLAALEADPELRGAMAQEARATSLSFGWAQMVDRYLGLYRRLTETSSPANGAGTSRVRKPPPASPRRDARRVAESGCVPCRPQRHHRAPGENP